MTYQDLNQIKKEIKSIRDWPTYREKWGEMLNKWGEVEQLFSKMTVKELKKFTWKTGKKAELVRAVTDAYYNGLIPTKEAFIVTSWKWGEAFKTDEQQHKERFEKFTAEDFQKYLDKIAEIKEIISNPVTVSDFREKARHQTLTEAEFLTYCKLVAVSEVRVKTSQKFKIPEIGLPDGAQIVEAYHDKKEIPLFVVQLGERIPLERFKELRQKAKACGGYYSKFARGNAKPGFQFETMEAAQAFAGGDTEQVKELEKLAKIAESQTRAERIKELAERWKILGEESLNADRLDNTARRASMAAHAEARASEKINRAKILLNLAEAIEMGQGGPLQMLRFATDLETLLNIRQRAYFDWIRSLDNNFKNRPEFDFNEVFKFIRIPVPTIHADRILNWADTFKNTDGLKMAANRLGKLWAKCHKKGITAVPVSSVREDLKKISAKLDKWDQETIKEAFADSDRVQRMGLNSRHAIIGAILTLQEIWPDENEQSEALKRKTINRRLIGRKIDGFFPTPESVVSLMLENIDFPAGCSILEPSAGLGHIAEALPGCDVMEINYNLREALQEKGFNVVGWDFLTETNGRKWDRIVMNPPFEQRQDEQHVKHAFNNCLLDGGRLISVMAANKKGTEFENWVHDNGGRFIEVPEGSFYSSFRPTGVNTVLVVM